MKFFLIFIINFYQKFISGLFPGNCRFYPTCSAYTKEAILKYGVFKGTLKGIYRILKCHPFHPGGFDPLE